MPDSHIKYFPKMLELRHVTFCAPHQLSNHNSCFLNCTVRVFPACSYLQRRCHIRSE